MDKDKPRQNADGAYPFFRVRHQAGLFVWANAHLFSFRLWAEVQGFKPDLGSASGGAGSTFRRSHFHLGTSCSRFHSPRKKSASRATFRRQETGLHRIYRDLHRGLGAWDVTAAIAIIFLGVKTLRLKAWGVNTKPPSKSFVIPRNSSVFFHDSRRC